MNDIDDKDGFYINDSFIYGNMHVTYETKNHRWHHPHQNSSCI